MRTSPVIPETGPLWESCHETHDTVYSEVLNLILMVSYYVMPPYGDSDG